MSVLRIDASIQGQQSASSALADLVTDELVSVRPRTTVVSRHLGRDPLPADAWATAIAGTFTPEADRSDQQREALELAGVLADELRAAEGAVLALPLYNWGVSQHVKTWFDLAMAGGQPGEQLLAGKSVVLVVTRGGAYGPGTPKEGWDHATDYLVRVLGEVWGADVTLIERELTLAGVNPAMDALKDLADQLKAQAEESAVKAGAALASNLPV